MELQKRLASLLDNEESSPRLLIVLAHPDDEVLAVGGRLERLTASRFLCVTDGVPRDGKDAHDHGFSTLSEYRAARRRELHDAFKLAGLDATSCATTLQLGHAAREVIADQTAALHLVDLSQTLLTELQEFAPEAVLTHPYEGGHPDHDACAFAVHAAVRLLSSDLPVLEAPFYHAGPQDVETGNFLPGGPTPALHHLSAEQGRRKQERLACFVSQAETLALFKSTSEQFRVAPSYTFTQRPHAGTLFYENFPWGMSGDRFCRLAESALEQLGLHPVS